MAAPQRFVEWMSGHTANDKKFGRTVFRYHPRSDEHSKMLCRFVLDDLIEACPALAAHAASGKVVGGINAEHSKTKPRIFDELSSSHEIVHQGDTEAIAAGIVVVNISDEYASPTRQVSGEGDLIISRHRQPDVTESMVTHLRGLLIRDAVGQVGFDAFCTIVIECDNTGGPCTLHTDVPAPQPGDRDHYDTFVARIATAYSERFNG